MATPSYGIVQATGNCVQSPPSETGSCSASDTVCTGNVAVTSYTSDLWHTFAHEMGHALGADHTFVEGALIA